MRHTKFLLAFISILSLCSVSADRELSFAERKNFIEEYKDLAIKEMHLSGIPASITLAQFILESSWGKGELFTTSNACFGIKCKENWTGEEYYIEDDDRENGKIIKSCFRSYPTVEAAFADHSDFLKNRHYYKPLFLLDSHDYKAWAYGLKDCGYATDTNYSKSLIRLIETYGLHIYDYAVDNAKAQQVEPQENTRPNLVQTPMPRPSVSSPVARPMKSEATVNTALELVAPSYVTSYNPPNPQAITPITRRKKRRALYRVSPGHRRPVAVYAP